MRINQSRQVTDVISGDACREGLISGVNKLYEPVAATLGASGRTIIIEDVNGNPQPTKDGVTVAKDIVLADPVERMGCETLKQAALNTASLAGDGTTTATVIGRGIIERGLEALRNKSINYTDFNRGMTLAVEHVTKELDKQAQKVNLNSILNVATISANNDTHLGEIIAKAFKKAGKNGVVIMDNSETSDTYVTVTEGFELENGFTNDAFVNIPEKNRCELEDALVILSNLKIERVAQIEHLLEHAIVNNRPLVIVSEMEEDVLATLAINKNNGVLKSVVVSPSHFGQRRRELLTDLSVSTGATIIDDLTGDNFENVLFDAMGSTPKVTVSKQKTVFIGNPQFSAEVKEHISLLQRQSKESESAGEKEWISKRIAKISSSVAIIHVGASSGTEQSEIADRVDDAINATQAALSEGIVAGGGIALKNIQESSFDNIENNAIAAGFSCVIATLTDPLKAILTNGDYDYQGFRDATSGRKDIGMNVKTGQVSNMFDMKIIDPVKVTKSALINGVSAASTLLSTTCVIVKRRG
jgi:chaperonin GroEL